MTDPDVRVMGEIRHLVESGEWECSAYGGSFEAPIEVRVTAETEDASKAAFIAEWNERAGTNWAEDQFAWTYNQGR